MTIVKHFGQSWTLGINPGRGNQGHIRHGDRKIDIDPTVKVKEMAVDIMLHEVIHNIESSLGLNLSESDVQALTTGMLSFLLENGVNINPLWKLIQDSRR